MRKSKFVLLVAATLGAGAAAVAQVNVQLPLPGANVNLPRMGSAAGIERHSYVLKDTGEEMSYAVFVSRKVKKSKPAPLVIALHALGGQPGIILQQVRQAAEKHGYIVVAPMGYNPNAGFGAFSRDTGGMADPRASELSERDVLNVLKLAMDQYNVDENRVYIMGHSLGGGGALYLGIKYSAVWAAVGATAPAVGSAKPQDLEKVRDLPFIIVHGEADKAVPVRFSRDWAAKLKDLGMTYEYHELPRAGHEDAIFKGAEFVFDFFDKHSRAP